MLNLLNFTGGWKTYVVGVAIIAIGVLEGYLGVDIPSVDVPVGDALQWILNGLGLVFLRRGIKEVAPTA